MSNSKSTPREEYGAWIKKYRYSFPIKMSQEKLSKKFNSELTKRPFAFNQKSISRLERGDLKLNIDIETITEISKICSIPSKIEEELIAEISPKKSQNKLISLTEEKNLLVLSTNEEFSQYYGDYECVFFSTDSQDARVIHGKINIGPSQALSDCIMSLIIIEGERIIKKYTGIFFINKHYEMCYSILIGELKQEVCMLIFKNIKKTISKNRVNIALALTTSSGNQKRPTMHRVLISRTKITNKNLELLLPQLKLNTDIILISESSLKQLEEKTNNILKKSNNQNEIHLYNAIRKSILLIRNLSNKEIYHKIDEALIYDTCQVSDDKLILGESVSIIRSYTESKYYNKVSQTVQDIVQSILENDHQNDNQKEYKE